ncbi:MAG: hypothetical protein AAF961_17580, partial [Planctomycetota bacterium]
MVDPSADAGDDERTADQAPRSDNGAVAGAGAVDESAAGGESEAAAPFEETGPQRIGTYLGNDDVVLIYDPQRDEWLRLPPGASLQAGDQLVSLPAFRSHVVLQDMNAFLSGGTQANLLDMADSTSDVQFGLELSHGQLLLNSGLNGNRIELVGGDDVRTIELGPSSSLAVDVNRVYVPGSDPEVEIAPTEITWYLTTGSVEFADGSQTQEIEAPASWRTDRGQDSPPQAVESLPEWIGREPVDALQRNARRRIAEALTPGEPVAIPLLEFSDPKARGRRFEDRALATESAAHVGEFEPFVRALNDPVQKAYWDRLIDIMRESVAARPEATGQLRKAFVSLRGPQAANDLMQMVLGYRSAEIGETPEEWRNGALLRLVRWMDSDQLDYRVLAFHNVNEITGT